MKNNLNTTDIFDSTYTKNIKLLAKIFTSEANEDTERIIYLLESHEKKYKLEYKKEYNLWAFDEDNEEITIEEINDFYEDVISKLDPSTSAYFIPQKTLLNKKEISDKMINFDIFSISLYEDDFKIKDNVLIPEVKYIDFMSTFGKSVAKQDLDYINMFLRKTKRKTPFGIDIRPRFEFGDGTSISIQASSFTYSTPREDDALIYKNVECGMPSKPIPELIPFAEDPDDLTGTVYPYTSVKVLNEIIKEKGISPATKKIIFEEIER